MILLMLAAAAPLLQPDLAVDLRCVAVLGVAADPALAKDGAFYTAIVGAAAMDATGQSREVIRDMIVSQVKIVRIRKPAADENDACKARMRKRIALQTPAP